MVAPQLRNEQGRRTTCAALPLKQDISRNRVAWAAHSTPVLPNLYCFGGVLVPELVPLLSVDEPALFAPLDDDPALFAPLVFGFVFDGLSVPLLVEPALFAPDVPRSELVPVFVRVRSVSLVLVPVLLLLGRVVGSLLVVSVFDRLRGVFVPVSLLSQPINAIPPNANAAATRIP